MPGVDTLEAVFPDVGRGTLQKLANQHDGDVSIPQAAAVLSMAADEGKVPQADYQDQAAEYLVQQFESNDDMPAGVGKDEVAEGIVGEVEATSQSWGDLAHEVIQSGDVEQMVGFLERTDKVGQRALANPNRTQLPDDLQNSQIAVAHALLDELEQAAIDRNEARIERIKRASDKMPSEEFRQKLIEKAQRLKRLMGNDGTDFEEAKEYVLDEENTPRQVRDRLAEVRDGGWDLTPKQTVEIAEQANEWMEEYHEAAKQAAKQADDA